jgi:NAD(P)-dependent dehydrogenase (short-subunit alcohol dehydrogenase family)
LTDHRRLTYGLGFLPRQLRTIPVPTASYAGQTIIVSGANGGLGLEAARHFVRLGAARVILACRDTERGETAKREIEKTVSSSSSTVMEVWSLDLCSFESVKAFCRRAETELERLDVLLANAGMLTVSTVKMAEGYEMQITVNVISTYLMALLLLPLLKRTAVRFNVQPAITVVASEAHFMVGYLFSLFFQDDVANGMV